MATITPTTVEELLDYWPGNIPFKGSLVSEDGSCMCAQGQALHFLKKKSAQELREIDQDDADEQVAELFGISRAHAVLLRIVNDRQDGAPSSVIRNPEQVLGDQAPVVLAFWRHLDHANLPAEVATVEAAAGAAREAIWAGEGAKVATGEAAAKAVREALWAAGGPNPFLPAWAAAWASNEIQGAAVMRERNQPFFFLPLFGFADPQAVMAADSN